MGFRRGTYVVLGLLLFVSLLIGGSFGLIWGALLLVQSLPLVSKDFADLAEADTWVLLADGVSLLIGEEHVG